MTKNILIVNPPSIDGSVNRDMAGGLGYSAGEGVVLAPIDLLNIAATLRETGWKVFFIDAVAERQFNTAEIIEFINSNKITVVIGNLSLPTIDEDILFYKELKRRFESIKIFAKTGINYPKILTKIIRETKIEAIIFTECDLNIGDYIKETEASGSVLVKNNQVVIRPVSKTVIDDLDRLPIPARDLTKIYLYKYTLLPGTVTTMQTSRGCPYPCGYYCPYPLVQGTRWRRMSTGRVLKEIKIIKKLGIDNILFRDATFTLDMKRAELICQKIIDSKVKVNWWCETRINVLNEKLLLTMKKAGCKGINVGVETLAEKLIVQEGKPGVSLSDVVAIRKLAKKIDLKLHFLMIVGLPNDDVNGLYSTFKYLVKLKPESAGFSIITPYPGTAMFDQAVKDNLIESFDWNEFKGNIANMRTKYLTTKEIRFGRWLLMVANYLLKKPALVRECGLATVNVLFLIWRGLKNR
jgi:radical SAM superfamily enzyme YgiQ (UPF0313 family)